MAIKKTTIEGTTITCEIESSNLVKTIYDSETVHQAQYMIQKLDNMKFNPSDVA